MTKLEIQKAERMALESEALARRALAKSDQLHAFLSLLDAKAGKTKSYSSARALLKKFKAA